MILKGEKVVLRPIRMDDAPRFVEWFNDPKVNKFMLHRGLKLEEEKKYIKARLSKKAKDGYHFCVNTKEGIHIGVTALENINKRNRNAEFGLMIGDRNYWNKGYGTDIMRTVIGFGFGRLKLHRIEFDVYSYNKRALALYKKMGFKTEGVKREHNFWNGKFWNTYHMAILDREWKRRNKK